MDNTAKKRMRRYRNKQRNETPESVTVSVTKDTVTETVTYDHDLTAREILTLTGQRTQGQKDRFPMIPLPFGEAYYKALAELT